MLRRHVDSNRPTPDANRHGLSTPDPGRDEHPRLRRSWGDAPFAMLVSPDTIQWRMVQWRLVQWRLRSPSHVGEWSPQEQTIYTAEGAREPHQVRERRLRGKAASWT